MKIAVCVKRVPDSETRIRVGDDGKSIDEGGVRYVINPYDEYAVEQALRIRDDGDGEIVVVSMGDEACAETIRTALAMGADRGLLLRAQGAVADPLPVARALAEALRGDGYDLILFGKRAIDDGCEAVGPMVAELLGLPCVSAVCDLQLADGKGVARREIEGGVEVVEFPLPAVLTADKGLNEPRRPALKGIMLARKKPLETREVQVDTDGFELLDLSLPAPREPGRILGEGPEAVPALIDALRNEVKVL